MRKENIQNNLCECFDETFGYHVWVQSDETGLWFNLNDLKEMFGVMKSNKHWFNKMLDKNDKRTINVDKGEGLGPELFIPEQKVHDLISKVREDFNHAVDFIYEIITDYDTTCINFEEVDLYTEERLALHAMKSECTNFVERSKIYLDKLGVTKIPEMCKELQDEINKEVENNACQYDNKLVPQEVRDEPMKIKIKQKRLEDEKRRKEKQELFLKEVGQSVDDIYEILSLFDN